MTVENKQTLADALCAAQSELQMESAQLDKIIPALVKATQEFRDLKASGSGNWGDYMTLDDIRDITEEALLNNGLVYTQRRTKINDNVMLVSKLIHSSGQWIASYSTLEIPANPKDINQAYGAALSYQKRYESYGFFNLGKGESNDPDESERVITDKQLAFLKLLLKDHPEREKKMCAYYKIDALNMLPIKYMDDAVKNLKSKE